MAAAVPAPAGVPPAPQWDQASLIAALNQMSLSSTSSNNGDWYFDTSASSHMGFSSGIIPSPSTPSTPSRIIVGDGSFIPITNTGSSMLSLLPRVLFIFTMFLFLLLSSRISFMFALYLVTIPFPLSLTLLDFLSRIWPPRRCFTDVTRTVISIPSSLRRSASTPPSLPTVGISALGTLAPLSLLKPLIYFLFLVIKDSRLIVMLVV